MSSEQRRSEFCSSAGNISAATKVIKSSGRLVFSSRLAVDLTSQERQLGGAASIKYCDEKLLYSASGDIRGRLLLVVAVAVLFAIHGLDIYDSNIPLTEALLCWGGGKGGI